MKRIDCLRTLAGSVGPDDLVVTSLGGTSDEWAQVRQSAANFYNSAMGSNIPLALGLAVAMPHRRVILLDTDGSVLMTLGALCTLGALKPPNLRVFVLDNAAYLATGGQPTPTAGRADLAAIARGAGIDEAETIEDPAGLENASTRALTGEAFSFAVVKVENAAAPRSHHREDHLENTYRFVRYIEGSEPRSEVT